MNDKTFGHVIFDARNRLELTVKDVIARLISMDRNIGKGNKKIYSKTYFSKVELQDEIPTPDMICALSGILDIDTKFLLNLAKLERIKQYDYKLTTVYHKAYGLYRLALDAQIK